MDSTWFAVDEDGEVAYFDAGEGGAVPLGGFPLGGEAGGHDEGAMEEIELLAAGLWARAANDERLREVLPDSFDQVRRSVSSTSEWDLVDPLLRSVGIWTYWNDYGDAVPYVRTGQVPRPLRVSDLDEDTQRRLRDARLPLRFAACELIAPGEHISVATWGPVWFDTAGRPHPADGREAEFAAIAPQLEAMDADDHFPQRAEPGELFEGEAFYGAVEKLLKSRSHRGLGSQHDGSDDQASTTSGCLGILFLWP